MAPRYDLKTFFGAFCVLAGLSLWALPSWAQDLSSFRGSTTVGAPTAGAPTLRLVADLENTPIPHELFPSTFMVAGDQAYFAARGSKVGIELWRSDGTADGTHWVADLCPGICDGRPRLLATDGERVLFASQARIWLTDGTDSGTVPLAGLSDNRQAFRAGKWTGEVFLFQRREAEAWVLWATDGSPEGTRTIDLPGLSVVSEITAGSRHYFAAADEDGRTWLYETDGSQRGTRAIQELCSDCGSGVSEAVDLAAGLTIFTSNDPEHGTQPWVTDGTAEGTRRLAEFVNDSNTPARARDLQVLGNRVVGRLAGGCFENCLFETDGTPAGTRRTPELYPSTITPRTPTQLASVAGTLYAVLRPTFSSGDQELWVLEPVGNGRLLAAGGTITISHTDTDTLYFTTRRLGDTRFLATDGTVAGTRQVLDRFSYRSASLPEGLLLAVYGDDGSGGLVTRLWLSDGSAEGTVQLAEFDPPLSSSNPRHLSAWQDRLAAVTGEVHSASLWLTDGEQTELWAEDRIILGVNAGEEHLFAFDRRDGLLSYTSSGSEELIDLNGQLPVLRQPLGNRLFISPNYPGQELWVTAGTQASTELVVDIQPGWVAPCSGICLPEAFPRHLTVVGDRLIFSAFEDAEGLAQLWATDGSAAGTTALAEFARPSEASAYTDGPTDLVSISELGYFKGWDPEHGLQLWQTDATVAGTRRLTGSGSGPQGEDLDLLTAWNQHLILVEHVDSGDRIWRLDDEDLRLLVELPEGHRILSLVAAAKRLYWLVNSAEFGTELGFTLGSPESFTMLDLYPGPRGSGPSSLVAVDAGLFFAADAGAGSGHEPWFLASGTAQPQLLGDLWPGPEPSSPGPGVVVGNGLYFAASAEGVGRELFVLDLTRLQSQGCIGDSVCPSASTGADPVAHERPELVPSKEQSQL